MAFVSEQERGLDVYNYENAHLGPGRYMGIKQYKVQPNYAPFSSIAERSKDEDKKNKKFITPGPGQYQIAKPFGGVETLSSKSAGTVDANTLIRPTSIFKSRQDRFKSFETPNPGPGSYDAENDVNHSFNIARKKKSLPTTPEKKQILEGLRSLNSNRRITSIPNRIIKIYHDPAGDMVDIGKMIELSGVEGGGGVGPGKYEIKDTFAVNKNKGSTAWAKNQGQRFKELYSGQSDVQKQLLGPGKYNPNKKVVPKYKLNPSSNFVSETVRSYYDSMYYHTTNEMKAQIRKETGYKDNAPGPGQYGVENFKKAIDIKTKPLVHQYFGSTLERFKDRDPEFNIAPGQYNVVKPIGQNLQAAAKDIQVGDNSLKIGFASTQQREDPQLNGVSAIRTPGVGSYDINAGNTIKDNLVRKFHMGYKGKFGSAEERFKKSDQEEKAQLPGPGQYSSSVNNNDKSNCDNSFFKSSTMRNPFGPIDKEIPGSGEYNVNYQSINYKLEKQKLFIENLKKIEVSRPAFDSSNDRFAHYSKKRPRAQSSNMTAEQILQQQSPQQSNPQNFSVSFLNESTNQVLLNHRRSRSSERNILEKPVKQYAAPFLNNSKKIDYLQPSTNPGPGKYRVAQQAVWTKRSYNIKYQTQG